MSADPIKVAVIGGGCAAMALVWELTKPELNGRYQVTVYQEGWRLGGKGASGRGPSGRIEEHGLHIWLGFYDNSFRMMRECHAELEAAGLGDMYGDWREAWTPENDVALCSPAEDGGFEKWTAHMPPRPGLPGDPLPADAVFSLPYYIARGFELFRSLVHDTRVDGESTLAGFERPAEGDVAARIAYLAKLGTFAGTAALAEALGVLAALIRSVSPAGAESVLEAAEGTLEQLRRWIEDRWIADDPNRFLWEIADLALASTVGLIRYQVMSHPRGLESIDDYECREWMRINGASERALQSPFIRGLYDLAMGYENGDPEKPCISAGQGLRGTMRTFFGYRGAFMWRMRAGMGDVVFAPLYTALKNRGVRFEFFHRLTNMGLGEEKDHISSLTFDVQGKVKGDVEYDPFVTFQGKPCWPSQPDLEQLTNGKKIARENWNLESHWDRRKATERTLEVSKDFDFVALAIGLGAVPYVSRELVEHDERWAGMCANVKTVASQAFQLWLDEDIDRLGWEGPAYITGASAKPFDTWCDMAHVVPEEDWRKPPATSVYFCAVLPDPDDPIRDTTSPARARMSTPLRTCRFPKLLCSPVISMTGGAWSVTLLFPVDLCDFCAKTAQLQCASVG